MDSIVSKIRDILNKLQITYTEHDVRNGGKNFYISRKYIPFFKQFYLKENRRIPTLFKNASVPALKRLLEGIMDGDGIEKRKIICPSFDLASDYQEIIYKIESSFNSKDLNNFHCNILFLL